MRTPVHDAIAVVGFIVLATTRLDTLRVIAGAAVAELVRTLLANWKTPGQFAAD